MGQKEVSLGPAFEKELTGVRVLNFRAP